MPRERRTLKSTKNASSKGNIKIAAPQMTLTGFEHTNENIQTKKKLDKKEMKSSDFEVLDSGRRSRSRHSQNVSYRNYTDNPPSEGKSNRSQSIRGNFAIEGDVPMDQEINQDLVSNHSGNVIMASKEDLLGVNDVDPMTEQAAHGCDPRELDPRNYAFIPS